MDLLVEKAFRRVGVSGTFGEGGNCGQGDSRHSLPVFPLSRYGPAGSSQRQKTQIVQS